MKVVLGAFTCSSVEGRLGVDPGVGVRLAALHYGRRLRSGDPPVPPPLRHDFADDPETPTIEVDVDLDPESAWLLEAEAQRTGVDLRQVLTHAVLVYLADLDRERERCGGRERGRPPLRRL